MALPDVNIGHVSVPAPIRVVINDNGGSDFSREGIVSPLGLSIHQNN